MGGIIQLLPDSVANQIAAGEVIQRPASVIKELVENAIDAGASLIQVWVVNAGKTNIQVVDNGCGLSETDARLAFERHATSKIRNVTDLYALHTMGFRGEALPSIVAVAQVELKTRTAEEELGTRLLIEGSKIIEQEPIACPVGANFSVNNLFYNIPARRKFLKSNQTELNNILNEFERIALANPSVAMQLHNEGNCLLNLPLLFWASRETGDGRYEDVARRHLDTAISLVLRSDDSTFHTYFFDPETGRPTHGVTAQGNRDGSAWSRGQAWGVYGTALAWRYTHEERTRDVFSRCLDFFLDHLPGDIIPYWDFDFSNPSTEPRDSSALAIVICGMLEASRSMPGMEGLEDVARRLMKVLIDKCAVMPGGSCNGLLAHATYARKSQWNTCRNRGVDECNIWGDYYYLEALRRLKGEWDPYW